MYSYSLRFIPKTGTKKSLRMTLSFERLEHIPHRSKFAVYAFIRQVENVLLQTPDNSKIIPDTVIKLIILFYAMSDAFEYMGKFMKLERETQSLVQTMDKSNSAFLFKTFDSGLHHWKFKVNKCYSKELWSQTVGIWKIELDDDANMHLFVNNYFTEYSKRAYGFAINAGKLISRETGSAYEGHDIKKYGEKTKTGDIIDMYCDMSKLELSFAINDRDFGKAFDIDAGKYRAAVNLYDSKDSISLMDDNN